MPHLAQLSNAEVEPWRPANVQVWAADSAPRDSCWDLRLSHEAHHSLKAQGRTCSSPHDDFLAYSVRCRRLIAALPDAVLLALTRFRTDADALGSMIVRGLPIDDPLAPTPADGGRSNKTTFVSEGVLGGIAQLFGDLYCYSMEKKGEIIQNIVPVLNREHKCSNEGSASDFLLHTENAYFDFRPDYLLLIGLRADKGSEAATTIAYTTTALSLLLKSTIATLRQPLYRIAAPDSFLDAVGQRVWSRPTPIISGSADHPESRVNFNGVTALTPVAAAALAAFQDALDAVTMKIVLQPGELLIIDNRKAVHGRIRFKATFGPQARWLQRAYVRSSLWQGRDWMAGRSYLFHS